MRMTLQRFLSSRLWACLAWGSVALMLPMGPVWGQTTAPPNNPSNPNDPRVPLPSGAEPAPTAVSMPSALPMPAAAAVHSAAMLAREPLAMAVERAKAPALVTAPVLASPVVTVTPVRPNPMVTPAPAVAGPRPVPAVASPAVVKPVLAPSTGAVPVAVGEPLGDGVRVLRAPGGCTPKTNSLDCVQDSSDAVPGANVSGRVRNSVIGEVGSGRAATEGAGGAQRQTTCTPKPGELSCSP